MINGDIYKADLENRFKTSSGYTISETIRGNLTCVEVVNGVTNAKAESLSRDGAIWLVRQALVGGTDILPKITTIQRDAASSVKEGQVVWNTTTSKEEKYINGAWV